MGVLDGYPTVSDRDTVNSGRKHSTGQSVRFWEGYRKWQDNVNTVEVAS